METVNDNVKRAILSASLETWLFDNIRGFAEAALNPDAGGRSINIEGRIALDEMAEYVLRRVRQIEDAKL